MNTVAETADAAATTMTTMTAPASGSTRASTRPRCATRCRPRSSRTWSASTPTTSISSARCSPAIHSTCSTPAKTKARPTTEKNEVLFASLTVGGETKKYYRFQTPDDAVVDYYDETGKSAKKFLVRKPVNNAIMRSGFGGRRHPILGYVKMHTGVDWATPYGTPIFASGNGVVEKVGWEGGYGKYIRIKHNNGYETAYGHMSAFAKGMEPGKRVRQGQVIGFVGSTGHRPAPTSTTKSWSTAASSIRCASSCRAAVRWKARCWPASRRNATGSTRMMSGRNGAIARMSDANRRPVAGHQPASPSTGRNRPDISRKT